MRERSLLNRRHRLKGFICGSVGLERVKGEQSAVADLRPRKGFRLSCSGCGRKAPCYDGSAKPRLFPFVPRWGFHGHLRYAMLKICCPRRGMKVDSVPWAEAKSPLCSGCQLLLAKLNKALNEIRVAEARKFISSAIVEGHSRNVNLTARTDERQRRHPARACGCRTFDALQVALYHALGGLPEPKQPTNFSEEAEF